MSEHPKDDRRVRSAGCTNKRVRQRMRAKERVADGKEKRYAKALTTESKSRPLGSSFPGENILTHALLSHTNKHTHSTRPTYQLDMFCSVWIVCVEHARVV